jgi:hypothetical protein
MLVEKEPLSTNKYDGCCDGVAIYEREDLIEQLGDVKRGQGLI